MATKLYPTVFIALLAGCVSEISSPQPTLWEAELVGTGDQPLVSGSAAAISRERSTEAGVSVQGLEAGTYGWRVREGDCDTTGPTVGADQSYPLLTVDDETSVSEETILPRPLRGGAAYAAEVRSEATHEVVACGEFTERA